MDSRLRGNDGKGIDGKSEAVVVVSAVAKVTDLLLKCADSSAQEVDETILEIEKIHLELIHLLYKDEEIREQAEKYLQLQLLSIKNIAGENLNPALKDELVSFGEILSSFLVSLFLKEKGLASKQVIATKLIVSNSEFMGAEFEPEATSKKVKNILLPLIKKGIVPVVTGFIASDSKGRTTTLGRGGSDYTASILGFVLKAKEVQIWTDVDGIFTADPGVVPEAKHIHQISFREASEMATFGAKVLHPKTIRPAIEANIPVRVLNTAHPEGHGTLITKNSASAGFKAISFKRKTVLVNIYSTEMLLSKGYLVKLFSIFAEANISVDLVSVSEVSVSVTLDNDQNLDQAVSKLNQFAKVTVSRNAGMISLIGEGIVSHSHIIKNVFDLMHQQKISIKMVSLGASDINISLVLEAEDVEKTVRLVHERILR